jgi:hypothetical protein
MATEVGRACDNGPHLYLWNYRGDFPVIRRFVEYATGTLTGPYAVHSTRRQHMVPGYLSANRSIAFVPGPGSLQLGRSIPGQGSLQLGRSIPGPGSLQLGPTAALRSG